MKDAHGKYFCQACGDNARAKKAESTQIPCPSCHKLVHVTQMVRENGRYVCVTCHKEHTGKGGSADPAKKGKLVVAVVALLIAAAIGVCYTMGVFGS
jgi:DNA-directed RNA polymerase subunit RPC12/RpoP